MSRAIGMDCINLRPTVRPAHYEASLEYHDSLIRKAMGEGVSGHLGDGGWPAPEVARRLYDAWDFDFLCGMHDGLVDWTTAGRSRAGLTMAAAALVMINL